MKTAQPNTAPGLLHTFRRYRTLQTNVISALPVVILMPHSACNCRCVMCDIWKDNGNLRQLTEDDVSDLMRVFKKWGTREVLMSGGEALLNPNFFRLCGMLQEAGIRITLLSTGLALKRNAWQILKWVDEVIVSLDGDEATHDRIRNVPRAFARLKEGVTTLKTLNPSFRISARSVIHRGNFRQWEAIVAAAKEIGLDRISFLPADVSSTAFNRETTWTEDRQHDVLPGKEELEEVSAMADRIITVHAGAFRDQFIAESPERIRDIARYYRACYGLIPYPFKKCNAPWVSTVIEADGNVRPCFFHEAVGNIHTQPLDGILNGERALAFRRHLDMATDETCRKCVCTLNLSPRHSIG